MSSNLGRQVKWQDNKGGWHTGRIVTTPLGIGVTYLEPRLVKHYIMPPYDSSIPSGFNLIKEDNCGTLTWVESNKLSPWPDVEYCSTCCKEKDKCVCKSGNQTALNVKEAELAYEEFIKAAKSKKPDMWWEYSTLLCLTGKSLGIKDTSHHLWIPGGIPITSRNEVEEEALLTLNSKLQEEYAEQVIQNQIECNYT